MRSRTYYRASLLIPVLVPVLLWPLWAVLGKDSLFGIVAMVLTMALVYGGGPYAAFVIGFLVWSRGKDDARVRTAALRAPFRFAPLLFVGLVALIGIDGTEPLTFRALFGFGLGTLLLGLAFGYLYVAVAELGHGLLRRRGWITVGAEERAEVLPLLSGLAPAGAAPVESGRA